MIFFTLSCPLVNKKRSNAVRTDSSGQLLPTSIAIFIAYGHNFVMRTCVQQIIAFKRMLWEQHVTVSITLLENQFCWISSTPLKAIVWFVAIMISLKTRVLKAPLSEWYFEFLRKILLRTVKMYVLLPKLRLLWCFQWNVHKSIWKNAQQILW